jgi:signal peptidase II
MTKTGRRILALLIALGVFGADRWSKSMVEANINTIDSLIVIPGLFSIIHSKNPGVAFGLFSENANQSRTIALAALSVLAVILLAVLLWRIEHLDGRSTTGLALILGGALGNVYDRVNAGTVTDFLDFYVQSYHWYTFNLADTAICTGAGLLVLSMLFPERKAQEKRI